MSKVVLTPSILIFQMRPHRAGAQVALSRLFSNEEFKSLKPFVVMRSDGWLADECRENGISYLTRRFPRSRSWSGRLWGVRRFINGILSELKSRQLQPVLVIANDYTEAILANVAARQARAPKIAFIRTAEVSDQSLSKYGCGSFDLLLPIGSDLRRRVSKLFPDVQTEQLDEGLEQKDFYPAKRKAPSFPKRILVVGSEDPLKGWRDMTAAIDLLERDQNFPALEYDFTGQVPDPAKYDIRAYAVRRSKLNFIGRQANFSEFVRNYDLVIHPSEMESFGLAMFEIAAAGVPILCSTAGEIKRAGKAPEWLYRASDPEDLAAHIRFLHDNWDEVKLDVEASQRTVRQSFMVQDIVSKVIPRFVALIDKTVSD